MNYLPTALRNKILDLYLNDNKKDWAEIYLGYQKGSDESDEKAKAKKYSERKTHTKPSLNLKEYSGIYVDKMYGEAEIKLSKGELSIILLPAKETFTSTMKYWHDDSFQIKFDDNFLPEGWVNFYFDENKKLKGFKIELDNPDFHFFNLDFIKK